MRNQAGKSAKPSSSGPVQVRVDWCIGKFFAYLRVMTVSCMFFKSMIAQLIQAYKGYVNLCIRALMPLVCCTQISLVATCHLARKDYMLREHGMLVRFQFVSRAWTLPHRQWISQQTPYMLDLLH